MFDLFFFINSSFMMNEYFFKILYCWTQLAMYNASIKYESIYYLKFAIV